MKTETAKASGSFPPPFPSFLRKAQPGEISAIGCGLAELLRPWSDPKVAGSCWTCMDCVGRKEAQMHLY